MKNNEERENTAGTAHEDWCHGIVYLQGKKAQHPRLATFTIDLLHN